MELFNISFIFMKIKSFPDCKFSDGQSLSPPIHSYVPGGHWSTWPETGPQFIVVK
jgi:hypothetical protein